MKDDVMAIRPIKQVVEAQPASTRGGMHFMDRSTTTPSGFAARADEKSVSMYTLRSLAPLLLLLSMLVLNPGASAATLPTPAVVALQFAPVVREHRYRMRGAIRPLLFWIGRDDVGSARIIWQEGLGLRVRELLIGSDPDRAPRKLNRWGWVREEITMDGARQIGLMRKIDEETLEEAKAQVGFEVDFVFGAIRTDMADGEAESRRTFWVMDEDFTYYDLDEIRYLIDAPPETEPKLNNGPVPAGTHPGILFAVSDLIERAITAATEDPRRLLKDVSTSYNFHAFICELKLRKSKWEDSKEFDGRRYERLVRLEFESLSTETNSRSRFTLVCGTEGELRGVPIYMKFQPKWIFKTEAYLDDSQNLEDPPGQ
jgi:hypothetical protein